MGRTTKIGCLPVKDKDTLPNYFLKHSRINYVLLGYLLVLFSAQTFLVFFPPDHTPTILPIWGVCGCVFVIHSPSRLIKTTHSGRLAPARRRPSSQVARSSCPHGAAVERQLRAPRPNPHPAAFHLLVKDHSSKSQQESLHFPPRSRFVD